MKNLQKEFVPYELAQRLKELGFNEGCLAMYRANGGLYGDGTSVYGYYDEDGAWQLEKNSDYGDGAPGWSTAPTFSQAFRWFRETYSLYYLIDKHGYWFFEIKNDDGFGDLTEIKCVFDFNSYEEAELACLTKLIEIVETKNK